MSSVQLGSLILQEQRPIKASIPDGGRDPRNLVENGPDNFIWPDEALDELGTAHIYAVSPFRVMFLIIDYLKGNRESIFIYHSYAKWQVDSL